MRRTATVGILAVILLVLGPSCSGSSAPQPGLAPPEPFPTAPTIGELPTTTSSPATTSPTRVEETHLYRVDPATLAPHPGLAPIPVGNAFWGATSRNGNWLAGPSYNMDGTQADLILIDLVEWAVAGKWTPDVGDYGQGPPLVTDDGTLFLLQQHPVRLTTLSSLSGPHDLAELPAGFVSWSDLHLHDSLIASFGSIYAAEGEGTAVIVTVDTGAGLAAEIQLPQLRIGTLEEIEIGEQWSPVIVAEPAVVWDQDRALIVHADQDVVTEVDLLSGETTDHPYAAQAAGWGGLFTSPAMAGGLPTAQSTRSAVLSPDGRFLFIASKVGYAEVTSEDDWHLRTDPTGLEVLDTSTWSQVDRLDAPIGEVHLSPSGDRLIGWGHTNIDRLSTSESVNHGVFVIDTSTLDVLTHHEQHNDDWFEAVSTSADGRFGYLSAWARTDIVDLPTGDMVGSINKPIQAWGEVGVVAEVVLVPG